MKRRCCEASEERTAATAATGKLRRTLSSAEPGELWRLLSRAESLTRETLQSRRVHAATLKLDGRRVALLRLGGLLRRLTSLGWGGLETSSPGGDCLLDCEERDGVVHVFDALMAEGRDLRPLPLTERLRAAAVAGLPEGCVAKRYLPLRSRGDLLAAQRAAAADPACCDGLIFVSLTAPYDESPLKFKTAVTFDFALEAARRAPGRLVLLASRRGHLTPFLREGRPCYVTATGQLLRGLRLGSRRQPVVAEFRLGRDGSWEPLRLRPDRASPNSVETLRRNLDLVERGEDSLQWLLEALRPVETKEALACWLEAQRRLLLAEVEAVAEDPAAAVVELLHPSLQAGSSGSGGGDDAALVGVYGEDAELRRLLTRLRPRLALLLCPPASDLQGLLFGELRCTLEGATAALEACGYAASARPTPPSPPHELLRLPAPLQLLAEHSVVVMGSRRRA
jgi:hypothetical protein